MGEASQAVPRTIKDWEKKYAEHNEDWFFGREPSELGRLTVNYWKIAHGDRPATVLDLGCGEGRDAVNFARRGFRVTAVDGAAAATEKARRLAEEAGVALAEIHTADLLHFPIRPEYDLVFAHNSLQFAGDQCLPMLRKLQDATPVGGFNVISVFTTESRDLSGDDLFRFDRNELKFEYRGWRLFLYGEEILWRDPAQMNLSFARVIAQKV